jgi:aminoglycoside phosphotransferase family enzyme/predicted kinase
VPEDAATPDELAAFLEAPGSYPHTPDDVECVATHLSLVALAGDRVYKVKKPVDLGFADFSTLEKRRHFCEEEVRLNRRLCAGTYEGVVAIRRDAGGELTFADTGGAPVAYAVEMKRLPEGGFLDDRIDAGDAGEDELEQVAQRLAAFYREREPAPEVAEWGRVENLRRSTDENFEQTEAHAGTLLPEPAFEALRYYTNRFLDARAALFARRRAEGRVLEGHGDLRLEHVHLAPPGDDRDEDVCIYDCIEFSERLRAVDGAGDVAFLAMDLDFHEKPGLALFFARRMAELLDDPELPALIDFYKTYRAHVRAKVDAMQAEDDDLSPEKRAEQRERAQAHYRQALQYATTGSGPAVIAVMGRVGTGKSTQARALAEALGSERVRSDRVRKQIAGVSPRERPDEATRERLYAAEMTRKTYAALTDRALEAAEAKRPIVLDATFGKRAHRDALRDALAEAGGRLPHAFLELTAPDDAIKERLEAREGAPQLSDARRADFQMLAEGYQAPTALEDAFHVTASADADREATTTAILKHLVRLL